jgi:hypothetical protein
MNAISVILLFLLFVSACSGLPVGQANRDVSRLDNDEQIKVVRQLLSQSVDVSVNRLGRENGFWGNPRVRIPLPEKIRRVENTLRRYGLERYTEELANSLNRTAEAALPLAKPVILAAIRDIPLADARGIVPGNDDAATRFFREHTDAVLSERLLPIVAEAAAQAHAIGAYRRLLKKATYLDKDAKPMQSDLNVHITRTMLDGLYLLTAEEERRIRRNPLARSTELLKKAFH